MSTKKDFIRNFQTTKTKHKNSKQTADSKRADFTNKLDTQQVTSVNIN